MTYVTAAAAAKITRQTIKAELGATSKQVSVRCSNYSMGSSIRVEIKDASVPFLAVEEIANRQQNIHRCQITGDILSGGNRYVSIDFADGALDDYAATLGEARDKGDGYIEFTLSDEVVRVQAPAAGGHAERQGAKFDVYGSKIMVRYGAQTLKCLAGIIARSYGCLVPDEIHIPDTTERREQLDREADEIRDAIETLEKLQLQLTGDEVLVAPIAELHAKYAGVQDELAALG